VTTWANGVTNWASQVNSLSLGSQWSTSHYPKYLPGALNFNPVIGFTFGGTDAWNDGVLMWTNWLTPRRNLYHDLYVFGVVMVDSMVNPLNDTSPTATYTQIFAEGDLNTNGYFWGIKSWVNLSYFYNSTAWYNVVTWASNVSWMWFKPTMMSFLFGDQPYGYGSGAYIRLNARTVASKTGAAWFNSWIGATASTDTYFKLGRMSGYVAEMIWWQSATTGWQAIIAKQFQIQSYLMIKYGIAPDTGNANLYSTTNALVWNASTSWTYNNNIFGIGRDTGSSLNSTVSESSTSTFLRVQSSTGLVDQQYMMLWDNNGANTWNSVWPLGLSWFNRKWLVQVTTPSPAYTTTVSVATSLVPTWASGSLYLAVDNDSDMTAGATLYPMTNVSGRYTASWLTLTNGQYISLMAGTPATKIGDRVWIDANNNGLQDGWEVWLWSVVVTLKSCGGVYGAGVQPPVNYNGTTIATTTTDGAGAYSFTVAPGIYYVEYSGTPLNTYKFTTQHIWWYGTNITTNSDAHPRSAKTRCENFASNITDNSIDAWVITQSYSSCDALNIDLPQGKNIAPEAVLTSSASIWWGTLSGVVDGIISTNWDFILNPTGNDWINFAFSANKRVWLIKIYNRADGSKERLSSATVTMYDSSSAVIYTYVLGDTTNQDIININLRDLGQVSSLVRSVKVELKTNTYLQVREIEIFEDNTNTAQPNLTPYYVKPNQAFNVTMVWYGQNPLIMRNPGATSLWTSPGSWRSIVQTISTSIASVGTHTISWSIDGFDYKLDYYTNPGTWTCPYRTLAGWVLCAQPTSTPPYRVTSINMNTSPVTPSPITYCTATEMWQWSCTAAIDQPQSALVKIPNTCSKTVVVLDSTAMCNNLVTDVIASDCRALLALYTGNGGTSWTAATGWDFSGDRTLNTVCDWAGITCNTTTKRVTGINISAKNVVGTLNHSSWDNLKTLTWLTNITIAANANLSWSLPSSRSWLTALTNITCYGSKLSWPLPTSWSTMTAMTYFNCRQQRANGWWLTGTIPAWWSAMPLQYFYVGNNNLSGTLPAWINTKTTLRTVALADNYFDWPVPDFTTLTSLDSVWYNSTIGSNCMSTGNLTAPQIAVMTGKFAADATTSWNSAALMWWRTQRTCTGDVALTSAMIISGNLTTDNSATYAVTVQNTGSRWAYRPVVTITPGVWLSASTTTLNFSTLAPWSGQTLTMVISKNNPTTGTVSRTNTFTLSDTSIIDSNSANNTINDSVSVKWSTYGICNNSALTTSVLECEALGDLWSGTRIWSSWTTSTNWMTSPTISSWFGIATTSSINTNLLWYYSFNSNNANDSSIRLNHGTGVGGVTYGAGQYGNAAQFDGTQKNITINNTNLQHGTGEFTYSWWTKWNATPGSYQTYFENGIRWNSLLVRQENSAQINIYSMSTLRWSFSFAPTAGQRYHLSIKRFNDLLYFYVNGIRSGAPIVFTPNIIPATNLFIGSSQHATAQNLNASVDEFRIYGRALSDIEISQLYASNTITQQWVSLINLPSNALSGSLNASIGNLGALTWLILNSNSLTWALPATIGNLANLQTLNLSTNKFNWSIPTAWGSGMLSLTWLNLGNNLLNGAIPTQIGQMPVLADLRVNNNTLTWPASTIKNTNNTLKILLASTNSLVGIPSWVYTLTNLTYLNVWVNPLNTTLSGAGINSMTSLKELHVYSGQIYWNIPTITIPGLTHLQLYQNSLTGTLPSMPNTIQYLDLSKNQLSWPLPASWSGMTSEISIQLQGNLLNGQIPASWSSMTTLQRLNLTGNDIEWIMPVSLFQSMTALVTGDANNAIGNNCLFTWSLTTGQIAYMTGRFSAYTPPNVSAWQVQRSCGTDLEVVSVTAVTGELYSGTTMSYNVVLRNNWPRIANDAKLTVTLTNWLQFSGNASASQIYSLGQMISWSTINQIVQINKLWVGASNLAYSNSFVISDVTTTDTSWANNTKTHTGTAKGSAYSICLSAALNVPQYECEALMDLYTQTAWPSWVRKDNWNISPDVETWFGVTLWGTTQKYVRYLCLTRNAGGNEVCDYYPNGNNLVGTIPVSIGSLSWLEYFIMSYNTGLVWSLPTTIDQLDNVTHIFINNNWLTTLPTNIGGMAKLTYLYAWNNAFTWAMPSTLNSLPLINYIWLRDNQFNGTIPALTGVNSTLRVLDLRNNKFVGGFPSWLSGMTLLDQLYIGGNPTLWWVMDPWICNMRALRYFDNNNNTLTGTIPSCISTMTGLLRLQLQTNNITGSLPPLGALTKMTYLVIAGNPNMRSPFPTGVVNMTWLTLLQLYDIWLTGTLPAGMTWLTALTNFYISNNYMDRDINSDAIIPASLSGWYNGIATKFKNTQWDLTPPTMTGSALAGTYFTDQLPYAGMVLDNSDFALAWSAISVGWGGLCSNITVTGNAINDKWLVAYYTFDNDAATDISSNWVNGTLVNGPTFTTGYFGKAINFDGTQKRVVINNTNIPKWTSEFTYSWWTKWNATPGTYQTYFENGLYTNGILIRQASASSIDIYSMGSSMGTFNFTPTVGQWYHLSVVRSGDVLNLFINGVQSWSMAFNRNLNPSADLWIWASQHAPTQALNAAMDDVRIYNRALSSWEIASMYQRKLNFAAQGAYNACFLTTVDRAWLVSNQVPLGTFNMVFSPYQICNNIALTIPQEECTALWDLYYGTNGSGWNTKTNWMSNANVDSWFGITTTVVAGKQRVQKICLNRTAGNLEDCSNNTGNNLVGQLTWSLGNLPYLNQITITNNPNLTGTIPNTVWSLDNITLLFLYNNGLTWPLPDGIGDMLSLQNLYLWGNKITGNLPSAWGTGLPAIRYIHLGTNWLSGPIPDSRSWLADTMDQSLVLSDQSWAKLSGPIPSWLGNFTKLSTYLFLHENNFSGPIPTTLGNLTWLQRLYLGSNPLSWPLPSQLGSMTNLRNLYLNYTNLTGTIPTSFTGLTLLTDFHIFANRFDRDLANNALIPAALSGWYAGVTNKNIASQYDVIAPVISWSTLAGTISANAANYSINLTEASTIATTWQIVTVGWGGTCSQMSVSWTLLSWWANTVQLRFVGSGTTAYSNCTLTTTDRGGNVSNAINLGNWSVFIQPYPVCSEPTLTISQSECVILGDFYTNMGGPQWSGWSTWWWMVNPNVGQWSGITVTSNRVSAMSFSKNNLSGDIGWVSSTNLSQLTGLTSISIVFNSGVYGSLPSAWSALTNLTTISIGYTRISWWLPSSWSALTNLTTFGARGLKSRGGWLTGPIPSTWSTMPLTQLNLDDNNLDGSLPSWLLTETSLSNLLLAGNNFDGPMPDLTALTNLTTGSTTSVIGSNCMGTGNLTAPQIAYMDNKFSASGNAVWMTDSVSTWAVWYNWKTQKTCTGNIAVTVTQTWSLTTGGNTMTYTVTTSNLWTRWAYRPVVSVVLGSGLIINGGTATTGLVFPTLAPSTSGSISFLVVKWAGTPTTLTNVSNTFTLSDNSIIDSATGNNTVIDIEPVKASIYGFCNGSGVTVIPNDCDALLDFYAAANGSGWTWWAIDPVVTNWYGIWAPWVSNGRVVILWIGTAVSMSGTISPSLGNLTELTSFRINSQPKLIWWIPSTIGNLRKLTSLQIYYVPALGWVIPSVIWNITWLTQLTLMSGSFIGNIPASFSGLTALTALGLYNNNLTGSIPNLSALTSLTNLSLENNQLQGNVPTWIGWLPNLTALYLHTNQFTGSLPASLSSMTNLKSVYLHNNQLTGSISVLWGLTNLHYIWLYNNQFGGPLPAWWSNLNLSGGSIQIYNNQFTGNFDMLSGLDVTNLRHFVVSGNNFDRDPANSAILPTNIATRVSLITGISGALYYFTGHANQWDITAPALTFTSMATSVDDVVQITLSLNEWSSTTGAGFLSGLDIQFTGSAACASLDTSPVKITAKWSMVIDVIGAAGTYNGCSLFITDRAWLRSNLIAPWSIVIPNYAICGTVTDLVRSDCKALVDIFTSTNGTGWYTQTNWMGSGDLSPSTASDWYGVTVTGWRVSGFVSVYNNMVWTLPTTMANLTGIRTIDIQEPSIVWSLNPSWSWLVALRSLVISDTYALAWNLPSDWATLTGLQNLRINATSITGSLPSSWSSMIWLKTLNLNGVGVLTGSLPSSWWLLTWLTSLNVWSISLSGPIPSSWWSLVNLTYLNLSQNNLRWLIPWSFANLTNLTNNLSNLEQNCLSPSTSYMSVGLLNILNTKFNSISRPNQKNCPWTIWSRVWLDTDNDWLYDNGETGTGGITVTLRSCAAQTSTNTWVKVLNHQLVAHYTFDASNATDDTLNGLNGTISNDVWFGSGKVGNAMNFSGTMVDTAYPTTNLGEWTIATWVNYIPGRWYHSTVQTSSTRDSALYIFSGGRVWYWINWFATNSWFASTLTISPNTWSHIAATYSGNTISYYINGVFSNTVPSNASGAIFDFIRLGGWVVNDGEWLIGKMDDTRVYGRALSASEISQLYNIDAATTAINFPITYTGAVVATATTNASGAYSFANVTSGRYYIEYTNIPAWYKFTNQNRWWYHNSANSDVNPWSAKSSCFELYNGLNEIDIDAGLKYLPYSSCEWSSPAFNPVLLGEPVAVTVAWYGVSGAISAYSSTWAQVLNAVSATTTGGAARWLKNRTYNWTAPATGTYSISWLVDGYNYRVEYYNNPSLANLSCAYRVITPGSNWCAVQATVSPHSGAAITNVNQIATIPAPITYCSAADLTAYPTCSTAGDQPSAMVVRVPSCTSSVTVTNDISVMCNAVTDMSTGDCAALVSLYDSTAGAGWTTKTNWRFIGDTTPRTACDWTGVVCNGGRAVEINFPVANNMIGILPALTGMTALSGLNLYNQIGLTGQLPSAWSTNLPAIRRIYISASSTPMGINGTFPNSWWSMSWLRFLGIDRTRITSTLPDSWSGMRSMDYMSINLSTWVTGPIPSTWSTMTWLRTVYFLNNSLSWPLPSSWSAITWLQLFFASNNSLSWPLPSSWSTMNQLLQLRVDNNTWLQTTIPTSWFTGMSSLQRILINSWWMNWPLPEWMMSWTNLTGVSSIRYNCMGTTNLSPWFVSRLNIYFPARWSEQNICDTDLQLAFVSKTWDLVNGNNLTYTLRYTNSGSRWSYNTQIGLSMLAGMWVTTGMSTSWLTLTGLNIGIVAPGTSGLVNITINNGTLWSGLYSSTQVFTISDTTINDLSWGNNSYTDSNVAVLVSAIPICNNALLTIPRLECEVLFSWFNGLGWPTWTTKTNWDGSGTNYNANTWYGVTVSWGRVTQLNYTWANNLSGTITSSLTFLTALDTLRIHNQPKIIGQLSGSSFLSLTGSLKVLSISGTSLAWPVPAAISSLTSLKVLWLIGNKPTTWFTTIPASLWTMTWLTWLDLSNNYFTGSLPSLAWFTSLKEVSFANNAFTGTLPAGWSSIPFTRVNVSSNTLQWLFTGYQARWPTLNKIYLDNNNFDGPIPDWITNLSNLN
jgi:Leucine-rich repeat (LRR) protein